MAKKICISDFKNLIKLQTRELQTDNYSPDFNLDYKDKVEVWAKIQTTIGKEIFAGVNVDRDVTHIFTIRYIDYITAQYWILFEGKRYDILNVENIDEENKFMRLRCNVRGEDELQSTGF